jgi:hypothetical protein
VTGEWVGAMVSIAAKHDPTDLNAHLADDDTHLLVIFFDVNPNLLPPQIC